MEPEIVGTIQISPDPEFRPKFLEFYNDHLFCGGDRDEVYVINLWRELNPLPVSILRIPGLQLEEMHFDGDLAYVFGSGWVDQFTVSPRMYIFNIRIPDNPREVGWFETGFGNTVFNQAVFTDDKVISSMGSFNGIGGLFIIDGSEDRFEDPIRVTTSDRSQAIAIQEGMCLYCESDTLNILNPEDLPDWNPVGIIVSPNGFSRQNKIQMIDQLAVIYTEEGIWTVDLSDPESPEDMGYFEFEGFTLEEVDFEGNLAFIITGSPEFRLFDVSDPLNPRLLWISDSETGMFGDIQTDGNFLYVSKSLGGIKICDLEDPHSPVEIAATRQHFWGVKKFDVSDTYIRALISTSLMRFYNFADLNDITRDYIIVSDYGWMRDFKVRNDIMLLTGGRETLIYEVSLRDGPPEILGRNPFLHGTTIALNGDYAYMGAEEVMVLGDGYEGIKILNISDPEQIVVLDTLELNAVSQIEVDGDIGYASTITNELWTLDLSDPENPSTIAPWHCDFDIVEFVPAGDHVIVAAGVGGVRILDVSDPELPVETGYYQASTIITDVTLLDNIVYASTPINVVILDISEALGAPLNDESEFPDQFTCEVFPNPFNSSTTINYFLPTPSPVKLQIFDINGGLVETLVDCVMPAGDNEIAFDGSYLPAGIYLVRFEYNGFQVFQKIALIK